MKPYFTIFILPLLFFSVDLAGQRKPVNTDEEWEHWSETIQISAGVRKGLMSSVRDERLSPDTFYVWKPDASIDDICVLVRTNDGLYDANMKFDVSEAPRGFLKLTWPTRYANKLRKYKWDEISMIGTVGDNCDVSGALIVCTFTPVEDVDKLTLFIKTNGRTEFISASPQGGEPLTVTCRRLEDAQQRGVNCRCDVPHDFFQYGRKYFLLESPEGAPLGTVNSYELKIRL